MAFESNNSISPGSSFGRRHGPPADSDGPGVLIFRGQQLCH